MTSKIPVLIIEDEVKQAELIANYVREAGEYTPIIAHNGIAAFDVLRQHRRFLGFGHNQIKCILLDIRMPQMDGLEFLLQLRKQESQVAFHRHIPVVMLTAYDDPEYTTKSTDPDHGLIAGYLVKPIVPQELKDTLYRIIDLGDTEFLVEKTFVKRYPKPGTPELFRDKL